MWLIDGETPRSVRTEVPNSCLVDGVSKASSVVDPSELSKRTTPAVKAQVRKLRSDATKAAQTLKSAAREADKAAKVAVTNLTKPLQVLTNNETRDRAKEVIHRPGNRNNSAQRNAWPRKLRSIE